VWFSLVLDNGGFCGSAEYKYFGEKEMTEIILDLCGGTGAWSKPYKDAGYDVRNITLPDYDVRTYQPPKNVYGILAAPPCTMFSFARTTAITPRNLKEGMEIVIACLNVIWDCRYRNKLAFWALENPMGYLRQFLGKPIFTFQPYEFGADYSKKTDLWGYFNIPRKMKVNIKDGLFKDIIKNDYGHQTNSRALPSISDITAGQLPARRAITPQGFAKAFFRANK